MQVTASSKRLPTGPDEDFNKLRAEIEGLKQVLNKEDNSVPCPGLPIAEAGIEAEASTVDVSSVDEFSRRPKAAAADLPALAVPEEKSSELGGLLMQWVRTLMAEKAAIQGEMERLKEKCGGLAALEEKTRLAYEELKVRYAAMEKSAQDKDRALSEADSSRRLLEKTLELSLKNPVQEAELRRIRRTQTRVKELLLGFAKNMEGRMASREAAVQKQAEQWMKKAVLAREAVKRLRMHKGEKAKGSEETRRGLEECKGQLRKMRDELAGVKMGVEKRLRATKAELVVRPLFRVF